MACRKSRKTMIVIVMIVGILLSITTVYADTPSITINLKYHDNLGEPFGVEFSIYKVGEVNGTSNTPVFDSKYNIDSIPDTAGEMTDIIVKLKKANKGNPVITATTSSGGKLSVSVNTGIYYIEANDNNYGKIEPSVVWLPYYSIDSKSLNYHVVITPKAEPNDEVEGEIEYPTDEAVRGEVQNPNIKRISDDPKVLGEEAKTSDSARFYGLMGLALISILMMIVIIRERSRREEQNNEIR